MIVNTVHVSFLWVSTALAVSRVYRFFSGAANKIRQLSAQMSRTGPVDGSFDMARYETMWNEPEPVPGVDLSKNLSIEELLAKIKQEQDREDGDCLLQRKWVNMANADSDGNTSLRIMQWNILADALSIGKDQFVRCPPEALTWHNRRLHILEEILGCNPDVVTLQEVDHFGLFKHTLATCGFEGYFYPKPDSPTLYVPNNNGPDGVAIFVRTSKFEVIKADKIVLLKKEDMISTNQVSIIVHLKLKETGKEIAVATTHLKAKSGWEQLRFSQGSYLASYLKEQVGEKPLILCGDFNADYTEPVYDVFAKSPLNLKSVYREATGCDKEPNFTTWKIRGSKGGSSEQESKRTIDYIWHSGDMLKCISTLQLPSEEDIGENALPSRSYPSDHLSLAADFCIL